MTKRYYISEDECAAPLPVFCDNTAKIAGYLTDNVRYDCRKIRVNKAVQDIIWKFYSENGYSDTTISSMLLNFGPKANLKGDGLIFELDDGFVMEE